MDAQCPLCQRVARGELLAANACAVAIPDAFPVSPGHALIVSRRHVADFFDLTAEEQAGLWTLLPLVKQAIDAGHATGRLQHRGERGSRGRSDRCPRPRSCHPPLSGRCARPAGRGTLGASRTSRVLEPPAVTGDRGAIALAEHVLEVLAEGSFSATYKFALFTAILDLCIENMSAHGTPPTTLTTRQLAAKVLESLLEPRRPLRAPGRAAPGRRAGRRTGRNRASNRDDPHQMGCQRIGHVVPSAGRSRGRVHAPAGFRGMEAD